MTYKIIKNKAIKCLECGLTSYSIQDLRHLYCGKCRKFHKRKLIKKNENNRNTIIN
jgi:ribosomal protein L37E